MPFRASSSSAFVVGKRFRGRVRKVGQQAEMQVVVAIGEEADLQRLDQELDVLGAGEERRNHHQRAHLRRQAAGEVHPRQRVRRHQQCRHPVHHVDGELARGEQQEYSERAERDAR